ncbi:hypothetical protein EJ110_NYTH39321 [Nymphaea thermarum]|nr:hypothetical protein EJ110_NYTH39321 [Nymphaea thermarum]
MAATEISRVRREDCYKTKHDSVFSKWEILIGPSDWEDYSLGKDGAERYRIHNLPISSCPGLYELGIAKYHTETGRKIRKIDSHHVIVVYLGQADNVRTRLQQYGRAGSHLDRGVSFASSNKGPPTDIPVIPYVQQGPGLFIDVFSRGFPIVFRWAPLKWKALGSKKMGIEINSGKPIVDTEANLEKNPDLHAQVLKFSHSRPRLVAERTGGLDALNVCGVALANGSICKEPPVPGRKRCSEHKGWTINGLHKGSNTDDHEATTGGLDPQNVCGVALGNGSICKEPPVPGRKRCSEHKGWRINGLHKGSNTDDHEATTGGLDPQNVCGVALGNGSICKEPPVPGRKRCIEHKGRRINGLHEGWNTDHYGPPKGNPCVCGVSLEDGSFCMQKPVPGRKRCEKHKDYPLGHSLFSFPFSSMHRPPTDAIALLCIIQSL